VLLLFSSGDLLLLLFSSGSRGLAEANIKSSGKKVIAASARKLRVVEDVENFMVEKRKILFWRT